MGRNGEDAGLSPSLPSVLYLIYNGLGFLVRAVVHDAPAIDTRLDAIRSFLSHVCFDELLKPDVRLLLSEPEYLCELVNGHKPSVRFLSATVATNQRDKRREQVVTASCFRKRSSRRAFCRIVSLGHKAWSSARAGGGRPTSW